MSMKEAEQASGSPAYVMAWATGRRGPAVAHAAAGGHGGDDAIAATRTQRRAKRATSSSMASGLAVEARDN